MTSDRFYKMNATPVNTSHPKDHVAGSRTGGQEMAKMLEEMKVGTHHTTLSSSISPLALT